VNIANTQKWGSFSPISAEVFAAFWVMRLPHFGSCVCRILGHVASFGLFPFFFVS